MTPDLLFQAMIYLAAAVIVVPLAKRIGLGSVLGYLLAGIIIGPYLIGFIGEEGEDLMHFAEFGVVVMLFLVGLELEPAVLWRMRVPILGMGGLQVAVTTVAIGGLAYLFGLNWQASLAIGLTFSLSSTAIVLQTLAEKGLIDSSGGRSSFSVLLFQDIAVIPILAILPLLAVGRGGADTGASHSGGYLEGHPAGMRALLILVAVGTVVVAGRYLVPPLLRFVARARQRELLTGVALLLIVAVAFLMASVGLSPALGTFLGGVVLANSYYKHELESDLEPFKGLLLGLFFMAVGASIDFILIAAMPGTVLGLVVLLVVVKVSVLFLIGRKFKLGLNQNLLFSFGLAQTGEFAFVLLSLIQQEGIVPGQTVSLLLVVVAVSMALTPLIMMVNERFLQPRFGVTEQRAVVTPAGELPTARRIIVAGFDSFGAVVGRFLGANGVRATILDNDSDRVERLRAMGFEVYYGDATRFDLLETAGADRAEAIVIGLSTPELNLQLVETVKKHFPHLHQVVRAFDYEDTYKLMDAGVLHIFRDTLYNGVAAGNQTLRLLGFRAYQLERHAKRFIQHDLAALHTLAAVRDDTSRYNDAVRGSVENMEEQLRSDLDPGSYQYDSAWDSKSLVQEFGDGDPDRPEEKYGEAN